MHPKRPSASVVDGDDDFALSTEETFLLHDEAIPSSRSKGDEQHRHNHHRTRLKLYLIIFLFSLSFQILAPAQLRIFESIFCSQYYQHHALPALPSPSPSPSSSALFSVSPSVSSQISASTSYSTATAIPLLSALVLSSNGTTTTPIPETLCKLPPIQSSISSLRGWMAFFTSLPSLITAIPIGMLADTYGRRPFLRIQTFIILTQQLWTTIVTLLPGTLPPRAIWAGGALNFISGGIVVADMVFSVVITDITPREELAGVFFRVGAVGAITAVVGPAIAGGLMHISPWIAVAVGIFGLGVMGVVGWSVPETLRTHRHDTPNNSSRRSGGDGGGGGGGGDDDDEHEHLLPEVSHADEDDDGEEERDGHDKLPNANVNADSNSKSKQTRLRDVFVATTSSLTHLPILLRDTRLQALLLLYPFRLLSASVTDLLQLYVSNRYGWSLADAAFLYSLQGTSTAVTLFVFLPWLSSYLSTRYALSAISLNVTLARGSIGVMSLAYLLEGLAPNIPVLLTGLFFDTLASGLPSTLRALASLLVAHEDTGRLFSLLAIAETASGMVAYPASAGLFNVGLGKGGGVWLGLPYFVTAAMAVGGFMLVSIVRFERKVVAVVI